MSTREQMLQNHLASEIVISKYATRILTNLSIQALDPRVDVYSGLLRASEVIPEGWERDVYLTFVRRTNGS